MWRALRKPRQNRRHPQPFQATRASASPGTLSMVSTMVSTRVCSVTRSPQKNCGCWWSMSANKQEGHEQQPTVQHSVATGLQRNFARTLYTTPAYVGMLPGVPANANQYHVFGKCWWQPRFMHRERIQSSSLDQTVTQTTPSERWHAAAMAQCIELSARASIAPVLTCRQPARQPRQQTPPILSAAAAAAPTTTPMNVHVPAVHT